MGVPDLRYMQETYGANAAHRILQAGLSHIARLTPEAAGLDQEHDRLLALAAYSKRGGDPIQDGR